MEEGQGREGGEEGNFVFCPPEEGGLPLISGGRGQSSTPCSTASVFAQGTSCTQGHFWVGRGRGHEAADSVPQWLWLWSRLAVTKIVFGGEYCCTIWAETLLPSPATTTLARSSSSAAQQTPPPPPPMWWPRQKITADKVGRGRGRIRPK